MAIRTLTWQIKLPLLLLVFATAPVAVVAFWMFGVLETTFEGTAIEGLEALASAKTQAIEQFTDDRKSEVERIAQLITAEVTAIHAAEAVAALSPGEEETPLLELQDAEDLPDAESRPEADPDAVPDEGEPEGADSGAPGPVPDTSVEPETKVSKTTAALRRELGLILWDQQKFEELLVIDADGRVLVSTFADHEGRTAAELDYFRSGLGATYFEPVFMSPITERLTMVIATPIRGTDGLVVGVLAARLNLSRFFRMINDTTGLGSSGETVVGKVLEDSVAFMAPTRHDPGAALTRTVQLGSDKGLMLQRAARGEQGTGKVVDYRGQCVFAAWEHVPSLEWALVVKMDCAEAIAPVEETRRRMFLLALVVLALALGAAFASAEALVRPLRQLKRAADQISKGDFGVKVHVRAGDEVGDLAESFERMVVAIRFFKDHARSADEEDLDDAPDDAVAAERATVEKSTAKTDAKREGTESEGPDEEPSP